MIFDPPYKLKKKSKKKIKKNYKKINLKKMKK